MASPRYPGIADLSEARRLRAQNDLIFSALGDSPLPTACGFDTSSSNLRILDSCTADGYFLNSVLALLKHPESATLVGTDIRLFEDAKRSYKLPDPSKGEVGKIEFHVQDMLKPWPIEWEGTFDLVTQRCAFANAGTFDTAVDSTQSLLKLVKPGGWLLVVDGVMPTGEIQKDDAPHLQSFKLIGNLLRARGINTGLGPQSRQILEKATQSMSPDNAYASLDSIEGKSRLGYGAATEHLREAGRVELLGLEAGCQRMYDTSDDPPLSPTELKAVWDSTFKEVEEKGADKDWFAAWVQRTK